MLNSAVEDCLGWEPGGGPGRTGTLRLRESDPALSPELSNRPPPPRASHLPGVWASCPPQPGASGGSTEPLARPGAGGLRTAHRAAGGLSALDPSPHSAVPLRGELGPLQYQGAQNCPSSPNLPGPQRPQLSSERVGLAGPWAPSPGPQAWRRSKSCFWACPVPWWSLPVTQPQKGPGLWGWEGMRVLSAALWLSAFQEKMKGEASSCGLTAGSGV